ncbi:MAG: hypothetical protein SGJ19_29260 [Planctomycetia bacterium]|nr:hypothetical protein [Planctomycetia bacterium]
MAAGELIGDVLGRDGGTAINRNFSPTGRPGDGKVAAGTSYEANQSWGFVWPLGGESTYLPAGRPTGSTSKAASFDGSAIIGNGDPLSEAGSIAFRWTAETGVDDMTGWKLNVALDASENGRVMYGYGINPAGRGAPWVAVMPAAPEPNAFILVLIGGAALLLRLKQARAKRIAQIE